MKKVLHFVSVMDRAGQETFLMNMYRRIDKSAFQFGFLCTNNKKGDYDDEIKKMGGKIYYLPLISSKSKLRHIENYKLMKKKFSELSKEYNICHIHNYHAFDMSLAALAALKAGFEKVVVHSHSSRADGHLFLHSLFKPLLSVMPVIRLACSDKAKKWMYMRNDADIIRNGIDLEKFKYNKKVREKYRKLLDVEDKIVIGHVGRFVKSKNHEFLLEILEVFLKKHPNAVLLLIGEGELWDDIKREASLRGLDDAVLFLGTRADINNLYQAMDVFVFPSLYEGLGIVAIEAQTSDLPCVISSEIPKDARISDKCFVEKLTSKPEVWADLIDKVYKNDDRGNEVVEKVRSAGYSDYDNVVKLEEIYNKG